MIRFRIFVLQALLAVIALLPFTCFAQFGGFRGFDLPYAVPVDGYSVHGNSVFFNGNRLAGVTQKAFRYDVTTKKMAVYQLPWSAERLFSSENYVIAVASDRSAVAYIDPATDQTTVVQLVDGSGYPRPIWQHTLPIVTDTSLSYFYQSWTGILKFAKYSRHTNKVTVKTIDSLPGAHYSFTNSPNQLFYFRSHRDTTLFEVDPEGAVSRIGRVNTVSPSFSISSIVSVARVDSLVIVQDFAWFPNFTYTSIRRFDRSLGAFVPDTLGLPGYFGYMTFDNGQLHYLSKIGLYSRQSAGWQLVTANVDTNAFHQFNIAGQFYSVSGNDFGLYKQSGAEWDAVQFPSKLRPMVDKFHLNSRYLFFPGQYLTLDKGEQYIRINGPAVGQDALDISSTSLYEDVWFGRNQSNSYYSTDLGTTWNLVTVANTTRRAMAINSRLGQSDSLLSLYYTGVQITRLALSTDKGRTWRAKSFIGAPVSGSSTLFTVGSRIFLYNQDQIYRAENANSPFVATSVGTLTNLKVIGRGAKIGIVADGYAASSVDGGLTFVPATLPTTGLVRSPTYHFGAYWVVQSDRSYRSTDQMQTWQQVWTPADSLPINIYNKQGVHQIGFADSMLYVFGYGGAYRAKFNADILTSTNWQDMSQQSTEQLVVYPNPTNGGQLSFRLEPAMLGQTITVSLRDAVGKTWTQQTITASAQQSIPTVDLPTGVYSLIIQWRGGQRQAKVVIGQ